MKKLLLSLLLITSAIWSFAQQQFDYQAHSTTGSDTYTVSITNVTAYSAGTPERGIGFSIIFDTSSSGACTLNVNSFGAITINGDITADVVYRLEYNVVTDEFDMISGGGGDFVALTGTSTALGNMNLDMNTNDFEISDADAVTITGAGTMRLEAAGELGLYRTGNSVKLNTDGSVSIFTGTVSSTEREKIDADGAHFLDGVAGTAGQVFTSNGTGAVPTWEDPSGGLSDGDKGDITVSSSGTVWTIDNLVVTAAKLATLSSADLAGKLSDETGTGVSVFSASPALTGNPTAPTQTAGDNSTRIATTAYVDDLILPAADGSNNGYLTSTDWNTFNNKQASGLSYLLASGGTLTGANTITGTTTNIVKYNFDGLGVTHTNGAGIWFANNTAAASGNQQKSPAPVLEGQGWKTNATAGSQSVKWKYEVMPIQGAAAPTSSLDFGSSINGGAYTNLVSFRSDITVPLIFTGTGIHASGGGISLASTAPGSNTITLPTSGTISGAQITMSSGNGASTFMVLHNSVYTPANGSTRHNVTISRGSFAPTSTYAAGGITSHLIDPALDNNGNANDWTGIDINPTLTDVASMTLYGMKIRPVNSLSSFGHATPVSTVDIDGSLGIDITSTSSDITLDHTHHTVLVDASGAARTITLPAATGVSRRTYTIKKTDASVNAVTVDGNASETIDGATTQPLALQNEYITIQCNGTAWFIIAND